MPLDPKLEKRLTQAYNAWVKGKGFVPITTIHVSQDIWDSFTTNPPMVSGHPGVVNKLIAGKHLPLLRLQLDATLDPDDFTIK